MLGWAKRLLGLDRPTKAPPLSAQQRFDRAVAHAVAQVRARYEAAETTRENEPLWRMTDYWSAKAANSFQVRRTLKIRSRYESANNGYFKRMISALARDLIGRGPRLQVVTHRDDWNKQIQRAWHAWAKAVKLRKKLRTLAKSKVQDGEGFGLLVTNRGLKSSFGGQLNVQDAVQLDFVVIESDQVMTPDPGFLENFWVDGMRLDNLGNPTEFHVLRHHPGDLFSPQLNPLTYDKWHPRYVCHWFKQERPGQVRGVPEITPSLDLFAMLRRYTKSVLTAAEVAADMAAYLETEAPADTSGIDDETVDANFGGDPFDAMPIDRGQLTTLPWGVKLKQLSAAQPATTYDMFTRLILREVASCLDIPLNIAMGDSSGYNYSSGRLDHITYYEQQDIDRGDCEDDVLQKVFAAWYEEAVMIPGLLPDGVPTDFAELPHRWLWNRMRSIDPAKDAQADELELRNGTRTLAGVLADRGEDWEESMRQRARELALAKKLADELGVPLALLWQGAPPQVERAAVEQDAEEEQPAAAGRGR